MKDTNQNKIEKQEAKKKKEIARIEQEVAKRKNEIARIKKEAAKREMDEAKKEYNNEKSRIVLERLQLNWIKWNITCIALGFTAYKFYQSRVQEGANMDRYYITGRELGIFLISLGFITLLLATLQHKKNIAYLRSRYPNMHYSLALRLSYVILTFSVIVFLMVIFRT